ncbi:unnamed protein product [Paramecium pentaurelia]|uniref:Uncharacterized protein n=1 Tax=Paramecium pentaurelia TaxID=43138 RepID=A0A8S1SF27_9CILI|nr:unnamed protein product [Paramecium pentaurelia]
MIKTAYKKQPLIPKLSNLTSAIEIQHPLSCRQQKQTYVSFIQPSIKTTRHKENSYKYTKTPTKSDHTNLNVSKHSRSPNSSQIQSSQAILNVINQNIRLRQQQQSYQYQNYKSNNVTPQKQIQQEEQNKIDKIQTQELYQQIIKQKQQSIRNIQQTICCINHTEKKAKYFKTNEKLERQYFCSICAIQEAYEGFIYEMKTNQLIPKKQNLRNWTLKYDEPITTEQNRKLQQLNEFLELAKQLYDSAKTKKEISLKYSIQEILEEIESISQDIMNNAQNIIQNVESKSFQMILQNYVNRLQQFDIIINKQNCVNKLPLKKQVLISFQNKDSFVNPDQMESTDSLMLRESETQHFFDDCNDVTLYSPNF